jgi:hypothetical protein
MEFKTRLLAGFFYSLIPNKQTKAVLAHRVADDDVLFPLRPG